MKAEETIKDKIRRAKLALGDDFGDEEMMDEAIFKAGIKEVVEFIEQDESCFRNSYYMRWKIGLGAWAAKKKDWGAE